MEQYKAILHKYIPERSVDQIYDWIRTYGVHLKISRKRSTKLGDYRPPQNGNGHQITVNHDLNKYAFLVTLVHEIAHLIVWETHGRKARAHGKEWKETYRRLMTPMLEGDIFPEDAKGAIRKYLERSYASSASDLHLGRTLMKYDARPGITLESLEEGSIFSLPNGKTYKKGALNRKRYRCMRMDNKRVYLVSPLVLVRLPESQ